MAYQFDFLPVVNNTDLLLRGALFTLELTAIGAVLGVGLGIVGALVRAWNIRPFAGIFAVYVGVNKNEPALLDKVNQILVTAKSDGALEKNALTWLKEPLPADL